MTIADFHSLLTVVAVIAFVALIVWAFSKKQKPTMDRHAMIPLQDDEPVAQEKRENHG